MGYLQGMPFDKAFANPDDDRSLYSFMMGDDYGIIKGFLNQLSVTTSGMSISVDSGAVFFYGARLVLPTKTSISIPQSVTQYLCVQIDLTKTNVSSGTPGQNTYSVTLNQADLVLLSSVPSSQNLVAGGQVSTSGVAYLNLGKVVSTATTVTWTPGTTPILTGASSLDISNLQSQITTNANNISSLTTRMSNAENNINNLTNRTGYSIELTAYKSKTNLTAIVNQLTNDLPADESTISNHTSNITNLQNGLGAYNNNATSIGTTPASNTSAWSVLLGVRNQVNSNTSSIATANTNISSLTTRMTTAETNITTLQNNRVTDSGNISSLTTRVSSAESSITALQNRATTDETNITSVTNRITTVEGTISNLDPNTLSLNITNMQNRVKESLTLNAYKSNTNLTDISNQVTTDLAALSTTMTNMQNRVKESSTLNAYKSNTNLTDISNQVTTDLAALTTTVTSNNTALINSINATNSDLGNTNTKAQNALDTANTATTNISALTTRVNTLESGSSATSNNVTALTTRVTTLENNNTTNNTVKSIVQAIGWGYDATFTRIGNVITVTAYDVFNSNLPTSSNGWVSMNETIPQGYRPVRDLAFNGIKSDNNGYVSWQVLNGSSMQIRNSTGVSTGTGVIVNASWITADAYPS